MPLSAGNGGRPIFSSPSPVPSGTSQSVLPVLRSIAVSVPNGGAVQGERLLDSQISRCMM
jgi:hypothetical protein